MVQSQPASQVLKSVAGSLQRERDSARSDVAKLERDKRTLSYKVLDLARRLDDANSHIKRLSKDSGSLKHDGNPKDSGSSKGHSPQDGGSPRQEVVSNGKGKANSEAGTSQQQQAEAAGSTTGVIHADAQNVSLTPAQVMNCLRLLLICFC